MCSVTKPLFSAVCVLKLHFSLFQYVAIKTAKIPRRLEPNAFFDENFLSRNRKIQATLDRPCVQNVQGKIGETRLAGYAHGKATQRLTKDQVE